MRTIAIEPLTTAGFSPFGDVIDAFGVECVTINKGFAQRFNGLAAIDVAAEGGILNVSLFTAKARPTPIAIEMMERHPLGTQLFYPLQDAPWLVLVCDDPRDWRSYKAFRATGRQGVNYARNVWHHPLLVLSDDERFFVVDRAGPGDNLEERWLDARHKLQIAPSRDGAGAGDMA